MVGVAIVSAVFWSCAAVVSNEGSGFVSISLGSASSSRALTDVCETVNFKSVTVTVTGPGMGAVSKTTTDNTISLSVPVGSDRVVAVSAIPDWTNATAESPTLALEYGGSATVDIESGKTAIAAISLAVTKTKLVLPCSIQPYLRIVTDLTGSDPLNVWSLSSESTDTAFDEYGRMFVSTSSSIVRYTNFGAGGSKNILSTDSVKRLGVGSNATKLYFIKDSNNDLYYADLSQASISKFKVALPSELKANNKSLLDDVVAVDDEGDVYVSAKISGNKVIAKLSITGSGSDFSAIVEKSATYADLDLNDALTPQDMIVRDGVLYIAANDLYVGYWPIEYYYARSRGKVVAVRTKDMSCLWDAGWSNTNIPRNPTTEFYGPVRFVGFAQSKLYIADEGFSLLSSFYPVDEDRVVELDTDLGSITGVGLENVSDFFTSYSW
jgi:hypothetical protein